MFPKKSRRGFLFVCLFYKNDVLAKTVSSFFLEALCSPKKIKQITKQTIRQLQKLPEGLAVEDVS